MYIVVQSFIFHHTLMNKQSYTIDCDEWSAQALKSKFKEEIKKKFTPEQIDSWIVEFKFLGHISQGIIDLFNQGKKKTLEGDTETIEAIATINNQLIGLLHDRKTGVNKSQITYVVFNDAIEQLKEAILKNMNNS